jgi:acetolactate synthase II small subunit
LKVHLTVESERPQERLVTQLNKLGGILELTSLHAVADPIPAVARTARNVSSMYPV